MQFLLSSNKVPMVSERCTCGSPFNPYVVRGHSKGEQVVCVVCSCGNEVMVPDVT